uniref:Uncharacterized protein n=1 Tax=Alexandrium monilatum TaxID=311494 RepID=A0A7S4VJ02_9DINO
MAQAILAQAQARGIAIAAGSTVYPYTPSWMPVPLMVSRLTVLSLVMAVLGQARAAVPEDCLHAQYEDETMLLQTHLAMQRADGRADLKESATAEVHQAVVRFEQTAGSSKPENHDNKTHPQGAAVTVKLNSER